MLFNTASSCFNGTQRSVGDCFAARCLLQVSLNLAPIPRERVAFHLIAKDLVSWLRMRRKIKCQISIVDLRTRERKLHSPKERRCVPQRN